MVKRLLWGLDLLVFIMALMYLIGYEDFEKENQRYEKLNKDERLQYVLETYYDDLNEFVGIEGNDVISPEYISVADELVRETTIGCYVPQEQSIKIRKDIVMESVSETVQVLAHEVNHHKQFLVDGDALTKFYDNYHYDENTYNTVKYELDSEYVAHSFTAREGLVFFNDRGMSRTEFYIRHIFGMIKRGFYTLV